jgi:hypothetical protein
MNAGSVFPGFHSVMSPDTTICAPHRLMLLHIWLFPGKCNPIPIYASRIVFLIVVIVDAPALLSLAMTP